MSTDLRTSKKLATHRALARSARELTLARGLDGVTVEDIAHDAGVSTRTFFNYFSCKEEAVVGVEPSVIAAIAADLRERPADEDPFTALLGVLAADEDSELARRWMVRMQLTRRYPELVPRHMENVVRLERALVEAVADRLDVDPEADPYPRLVVAWAVATMRSTIEWWYHNDQPVPLREALDAAFSRLSHGVESARGMRRDGV